MNIWVALIIGLIIGWLVEFLIDLFYWRKRRLCPEDNVIEMQARLDKTVAANSKLEADLNGRQTQIAQLEATINSWRGELNGLNEASKGLGIGTIFPNGDLKLGSFISGMQHRFNQLRSELDHKERQIGDLGLNLSHQEADVNRLQADLTAKEVELGSMRSELEGLDKETSRLGLGTLFAGSGLALGGFLSNLRDRFDGQTETDANLEADLVRLRGDLETKKDRIGELEAELNGSISELQAQLAQCQSNLAEMHAQGATKGVPADLSPEGVSGAGPRGLSMVWGLNTQTSEVLESKGVYTYQQLGSTQAADVDEALTLSQKYYPGWDNGRIHGSWVEQSRLAERGDWDGLSGYQQGNFDVVALKDDLKKLWGIGPKIEQVFNGKGIYLFSQLASVPADRITEILRDAGDRFNISTAKLHESWPDQARLADQADWDGLKSFTHSFSWSNVN